MAYSIATVAQNVLTWHEPDNEQFNIKKITETGLEEFGKGRSIKKHDASLRTIKDYIARLHRYCFKIEDDNKETLEMMDFMDGSVEVYTKGKPFNKKKWREII